MEALKLTEEFTVILSPGEDGFIVAQCPELPGCISQGLDEADAMANIKEAIELCLESGDTRRPAEIKKLSVAV
jgi:predicted RNase H-like HicB family nuclease/predicted RNA binding protein YcfA (HicA-like mRNA interferase family)